MKIIHLLQTQPIDTIDVQQHIAAVAEKLSTTPVTTLVSELIDKAVNFGLKLLAALAIYLIGAWIIRKIKTIIARIFERKKTDAAISSFTQSIVSIALTVILIIITIGAVGIDTTSIAALLAGGGMAIGMALNGTVQNFAGGIMIIAFKPFKAGDYIQAQGYEGTVTEVNIVNTKLTTVDNKSIIIPNGALFNGTVNNFSDNTLRRLEWIVSVEYGSSSEGTKEVLMSLLKGDIRILNVAKGAPADPFVAVHSLSDSSVKFVMRGWVHSADYWDVNFDMNGKIYEELPKNGIKFPFPQMDIHVHQD
ncbi:MAG: mechanosensitive ion channel [Bacteroidales bacterium]|nr:mechanosensitive ion channel [Bacteroidales bacterium]